MIWALCDLVVRRYWVDRLDPWIFRLHDGIGIRWYGVAYLAGMLVAGWFISRWARNGRLPIAPDEVSTFILWAGIGMVTGGRLGYCLFYNAHTVLHHPFEIFAFRHGGMSSHGGVLGLLVAIMLFARTRKLHPLALMDAVAATAPVGIAFGRIANFTNGELWGRPTDVPWAVIFPLAPPLGSVQAPRHPSQLYAACIEGLLVFLVTQYVFARYRRPGKTAATFFIAYGIGRFIDEFWRQPDLGQPVYWGWMSKGQLLTLPMIAIGVAWLLLYKQARYPRGKGGTPRLLCAGSNPARATKTHASPSRGKP